MPDVTRPATTRPDTRPGTSRADPARPAGGRPDVGRPDTGRSETGRDDASRPGRGRRTAYSGPAPWSVAVDDPFGVHVAAYGAAVVGGRQRLLVRAGARVLDLAAACTALRPDLLPLVDGPVLNPLLAAGSGAWDDLRAAVQGWLTDETYRGVVEPLLRRLDSVSPVLPFEVADYVDFYASVHHATNVGRLLRPGGAPLTENWLHLPIGYHGRAGTVLVSGSEILRPSGQLRGPGTPRYGPSERLDVEVEVGFVLGGPTERGRPVALADAADHVFGVCLVNDWSARDVQAWESAPLGPFLAKSFATSVSPWVVPLAALDHARVHPPAREVPLLPYLDDADLEPWGLDLALELEIDGHVVSRPPFASMYWTAAQMLAHLTVNGASVRAGDLFASGTVSGPERDQRGCLLELTTGGAEPVRVGDQERTFLLDGDEVVGRGIASVPGHPPVGLGEVRGRVVG